jgi:hypothetical protein
MSEVVAHFSDESQKKRAWRRLVELTRGAAPNGWREP